MKSVLLLLACAALPVVAPTPSSTPAVGARSAAAVAEYTIDGAHSSVLFRIKHMNTSWFYGRFNQVSGSVTWDAAAPDKSKISLEIPTDSVDTADEKRDGHLKSPDFFNAAEFPVISFTSKSVAKKGDKLAVTGDLSLHGVTKSITAQAELSGSGTGREGPIVGFECVFDLKRSDFGIKYGLPDALGDEVRVTIAIECAGK